MLDLIIVTSRGILGDEDAYDSDVEEKRHITTSQCISKDAEIYELRQEDFLREAKKQANWQSILKLLQTKREKYAERIQ